MPKILSRRIAISWLPSRRSSTAAVLSRSTEKGEVIATRATIDLHESISTLRAWFAAADVEIPPLTIFPDVATPLTDITRASAGREESGGGGSEHCSQLKKGSAQ